MSSTTISVRVPSDLKDKLEVLSGVTHRSKSYLTAKALEEYVSRNAWKAQAIQEAVEEANKGVFVSGESVDRWLSSWGTENELEKPTPDIFPK